METPLQAMARMKAGPRPVIGCLPLYPPMELIHSMGLAPVVLWGLSDAVPQSPDADRHIQNYACSVCRRLTQFVINDGKDLLDGLFFYNAGDTLRNLPEILREGRALAGASPLPMFRMHIPMTAPVQADASGYLTKEIEALICSLEKQYGVLFSEDRFAESVFLYRRMRSLCLQLEQAVAQGRMGFADFCRILIKANFLEVSEQIALLASTLAGPGPVPVPDAGGGPVRVVVSGILPPPAPFCEIMDQAGFVVAGNDLAFMYRSCAHTPDTWQDAADYYVQFYRNHFPCTTLLYSADRRVEAILDLVSRTGAQGFVFVGEKFCEYEYFEFPYLERRLKDQGVAVLAVEISMDDNIGMETLRTRLEAFKEVIDGACGGDHGN
ncbi:MAG: 2-hydroxyacyl-CoA dehydratase subunit D [Thermodesulfobacteriota bacterium]